jgi:uncharacterized membrane protein YoaK (UPF0700 family)
MTWLRENTQDGTLIKKRRDPGYMDKVRWEKTVIKLYHLSLWLGFLAGAIMGI